jgi:hypothetical protein
MNTFDHFPVKTGIYTQAALIRKPTWGIYWDIYMMVTFSEALRELQRFFKIFLKMYYF